MPSTVGFSVSNVGTEADWARVVSQMAVPFVAETADALLVTSLLTSDRTVQVAGGRGRIAGLLTTVADAGEVLQLPVNNFGTTRQDIIALRTVWSFFDGQAAHTSQLVCITGPAGGLPPSISRVGLPDAAVVNWQPGKVYDAVLAVVETPPSGGALPTSSVFDLRLTGAIAGPAMFRQSKYVGAFVDVPVGARLQHVNGARWLMGPDGIVPEGTKVYRSPILNDSGAAYNVNGAGAVGGLEPGQLVWTFTPTADGVGWVTTSYDLRAISSGFTDGLIQATIDAATAARSGITTRALSGSADNFDLVARDYIANWRDARRVPQPVPIRLAKEQPVTIGIFVKTKDNGGQFQINSVQHVVTVEPYL